jgi:hypothetical protein
VNSAHGFQILGNEFGADAGDFVEYAFSTSKKLTGQSLNLVYATRMGNAKVTVFLDRRSLGTFNLNNTYDWFRFSLMTIPLGELSAGQHSLRINSNGVNVNFDYFFIVSPDNQPILIEAENPVNKTRVDHGQICPPAYGGKILDNQFGSETDDYAEYEFVVNDVFSPRILNIVYATELKGVVCDLFLDGKSIAPVSFPSTRHWWDLHSIPIPIGALDEGQHSIKIKTRGQNINLDALILNKAKGYPLNSVEAENYQNETRENHRQFDILTRGGKYVGNDFGSSLNDRLDYTVFFSGDYKDTALCLSYSTVFKEAVCIVYIDGKEIGRISCLSTGSFFNFREAQLKIPFLKKGKHEVSLSANGVRVNFDYFDIRENDDVE